MEAQALTTPPPAMTLEEICTTIRRLVAEGHASQHRIGQLYNHVVEHRLAEQAQYKSAQEYFSQHVKTLSRQSLVLYGAVARDFNAETCAQFGMSALRLLQTYAEVSRQELDTHDPSTMVIAVPDENGVINEKFFGECTVDELRKALQRLRKPTSSAPLPAEDVARAQRCHATLTSYFREKAGIRVEVTNRKGKAVMSLKHVPLEQMEHLAALLGSSRQPARAA